MLCIPFGKENEARAFYSGILGLEELTDLGYPLPNGAIWFQMGDIQLHVRAEESSEISQRHPAFIVENLETARKVLEDNGIIIKMTASFRTVSVFHSEIPSEPDRTY